MGDERWEMEDEGVAGVWRRVEKSERDEQRST